MRIALKGCKTVSFDFLRDIIRRNSSNKSVAATANAMPHFNVRNETLIINFNLDYNRTSWRIAPACTIL